MPKYYPTKHARLEEQGFKCKQGQLVDLKESDAAVFNSLIPGLLVPFDPKVHMPVITIPNPDGNGGMLYDPYTQSHLGPAPEVEAE